MSDIQTLKQAIHDLNQAWWKEDFDKLASYFHPEVVFTSPDFKAEIKGRDACLQTYKEYTEQAQTHGLDIMDERIQLQGDVAVVSYHYVIDFETAEKRYQESGRDIMVFKKEDNQWLVIWRGMVIV
jgi:uncharacterized protein (TIGR02246 family)